MIHAVAQYCDEVYNATSGSIVTAGYPAIPYQPNLDCYYTITIPTLNPINTTILFKIIDLEVRYIRRKVFQQSAFIRV